MIREANVRLNALFSELNERLEGIPRARRNGDAAEELLEISDGVGSIITLLDEVEEIVTLTDND